MARTDDAAKPKKERFTQLRQMKQVYDMTRKVDPAMPWILLGAVVGAIVVFALIGAIWNMPVYFGFIGFLVGTTLALWLFSRRAERAVYAQLEGQPGASLQVFSGLRRGHWAYDETPVAVDNGRSTNMAEASMVFRVVGLPGVILIGEGPSAGRTEKLLAGERKKVERLIPNLPVTAFRIGSGDGAHVVSARELSSQIKKLPKAITKDEVAQVNKRLKALTGIRPPVPQGMDPNRLKSMGRQRR